MPKKKEESTKDPVREFIDEAMERLKKEIDADAHNRIEALESLRFLNGEQWEQGEKQRRRRMNRPALTINLLPKNVDQVVGDMRQNRVRVKIRAVDSRADVNIAKIRAGIISNVEYLSNAETIYDQAGEMQVSCGYGAWRVLTRYMEENPFEQEIYLESIPNPFCVYMDSDSRDFCFADAKYGFILDKMSRDDFKKEYPNAESPGEPMKTGQGMSYEHWYDHDTITVAEYFIKKAVKKTICLMENGEVLEEGEAKEKISKWKEAHRIPEPVMPAPISPSPNPQLSAQGPTPMGMPPAQLPSQGQPQLMNQPSPQPMGGPPMMQGQGMMGGVPPQGAIGTPSPMGVPPLQGGMPPVPQKPPMPPTPEEEEPKIEKTRETEEHEIRHYVLTAVDILSEGGIKGEKVSGKYIPVILLRGKIRNIEGKTHVRGLIKDAKDPQRLVNYWETSTAELIALAPKTPWLGTAKMFEGYEEDYAAAGTENFPFLKYNVDPDSPAARPTQNQPAQIPSAMISEILGAKENLKDTLGIYNRDVGQSGPERTGAAIIQAQKPSDVGTFAFIDNLKQCIAHSGRIINEMIPEVYDTERDVRIRNLDDSDQYVPINTTLEHAVKMIKEDPERYRGMDIHQLKNAMKKNINGAKFNDLTVGKYDVVVTTGPSYSSQRAESAQNMLLLMQNNPKLHSLGDDLMLKAMDFLYADELADRVRKTLPQGMAPPREGEAPSPPLPPPPQVVLKMKQIEVQQMKVQVEMSKLKLEQLKALKEVQDAKGEVRKVVLEMLKEVFVPPQPQVQGSQSPQMSQTGSPQMDMMGMGGME